MAAKSLFDAILTKGKGRVIIAGMFYPQNTDPPKYGSTATGSTITSGVVSGEKQSVGGIVSIARTSQGLYTITLADKYRELVSFSLGLGAPSAVDLKPQLGLVDLAAKTIQIRLLAIASVTDQAADPDARVAFNFLFRTTSVRG